MLLKSNNSHAMRRCPIYVEDTFVLPSRVMSLSQVRALLAPAHVGVQLNGGLLLKRPSGILWRLPRTLAGSQTVCNVQKRQSQDAAA